MMSESACSCRWKVSARDNSEASSRANKGTLSALVDRRFSVSVEFQSYAGANAGDRHEVVKVQEPTTPLGISHWHYPGKLQEKPTATRDKSSTRNAKHRLDLGLDASPGPGHDDHNRRASAHLMRQSCRLPPDGDIGNRTSFSGGSF